ncbi:MAG TPA: SEC-C metal-binding domain-containing protein, partial [Beijerinckiaceae bacterium]|nr:SEC-C metal-binding domain-containing protein [Beijerinckiaceae bacterium]
MLIVAYPANGLGNCLRSILSTKILADSIGADFAIDFRHDKCPTYIAAIIRTLFPDSLSSALPLTSVKPLDERNCMRFIRLYGTNSDPVLEAIFDPEESFPKDGFGLLHIYSAKPERMDVNRYLLLKHENYAAMPFPGALQSRVERFRKLHDLTSVVGMHIRYTDNLSDPLKKNLNTPFSVLEEKFKSLISVGHRILLCTDNSGIRNHLHSAYPKLVLLPDDVESTFQPLYEMMLLAQTTRVIGTYSSTFSYEDCLFEGTDLELFVNGAWKTYRFSSVRDGSAAGAFGPATTGLISDAAGGDPSNLAAWSKIRRNDACPCGSSKKYKHCH